MSDRECKQCGNNFIPSDYWEFCSDLCRMKYDHKKHISSQKQYKFEIKE